MTEIFFRPRRLLTTKISPIKMVPPGSIRCSRCRLAVARVADHVTLFHEYTRTPRTDVPADFARSVRGKRKKRKEPPEKHGEGTVTRDRSVSAVCFHRVACETRGVCVPLPPLDVCFNSRALNLERKRKREKKKHCARPLGISVAGAVVAYEFFYDIARLGDPRREFALNRFKPRHAIL